MAEFDVEAGCIDLSLDIELDDLSIIFPGGAELKIPAPPGVDIAFAIDYAKQILAAVNAALMPLQPIFNIIDVLLLVVEFVKAVPDAITSLDPGKIIELVPKIAAKLDKLLAIIPPLSIPIFIKSLLRVILVFLRGVRAQLSAVASLMIKIDGGRARVGELQLLADAGKIDLAVVLAMQASIDCADAAVAASMGGIAQGAAPLDSLLKIIKLFVELVGLPVKIPTMASLGGSVTVAIDALDALIVVLGTVRAAIVI